jgi:hypothetical protein
VRIVFKFVIFTNVNNGVGELYGVPVGFIIIVEVGCSVYNAVGDEVSVFEVGNTIAISFGGIP